MKTAWLKRSRSLEEDVSRRLQYEAPGDLGYGQRSPDSIIVCLGPYRIVEQKMKCVNAFTNQHVYFAIVPVYCNDLR